VEIGRGQVVILPILAGKVVMRGSDEVLEKLRGGCIVHTIQFLLPSTQANITLTSEKNLGVQPVPAWQ
jgi:hypothetical protein